MPFVQDSSLETQCLRLNLTGPLYRRNDYWFTSEDKAIFGIGGLITPTLKQLAQRDDNGGIQFLIEIVMQQALAVATIWDESRVSGSRLYPSGMPNYHWYILGLMEARSIFIYNSYRAFDGTEFERSMHNAVYDLHFVNLWNALWKEAQKNHSLRSDTSNHRKMMYRWVLTNFLYIDDVDPDLLNRIRWTVFRKFQAEYDTEHRPRGLVDLEALMENFDFSFISEADLRRYRPFVHLHWGMYLYPEETRDLDSWLAFELIEEEEEEENHFEDEDEEEEDEDENWDSDDDYYSDDDDIAEELLRRQYDTSHLEAYGPTIDPLSIAERINNVPEHRNCTICVGEFDIDGEGDAIHGQQCLQMWECGHYFHQDCIGTWINGIAPNSNLCPECRGMLFEERRLVRVIASQESPRLLGMPLSF